MHKYLPYLFLIAIILTGCSKHHSDPQPQPLNTDTVSGKYVLYLQLDTVYDFYSATQYNLDVTHETLTGDTLYLKAGTANQVIQPNPIAGYNPKVELADTIYVTKGSTGYQFTGEPDIFKIGVPGSNTHFYLLNKSRIEMLYRYMDPDNPPGLLTDAYGWYYKKL